MTKENWLRFFFIISFYLGVLIVVKREIFFFKFDKTLIKRRFPPRNAPYEVTEKTIIEL